MVVRIEKLKTRVDFVRVSRAGRSAAAPSLVLQAASQPEELASAKQIRVGFTASRKVGNSVTRNQAKRRLRAAAASVLSHQGRPGTDYVLIARASTADRPFPALLAELEAALRRIDPKGQKRDGMQH
ncbi:MAG: ribonuclease P protein component [Stellaceae bacterium]